MAAGQAAGRLLGPIIHLRQTIYHENFKVLLTIEREREWWMKRILASRHFLTPNMWFAQRNMTIDANFEALRRLTSRIPRTLGCVREAINALQFFRLLDVSCFTFQKNKFPKLFFLRFFSALLFCGLSRIAGSVSGVREGSSEFGSNNFINFIHHTSQAKECYSGLSDETGAPCTEEGKSSLKAIKAPHREMFFPPHFTWQTETKTKKHREHWLMLCLMFRGGLFHATSSCLSAEKREPDRMDVKKSWKCSREWQTKRTTQSHSS